MRKRPVWFTLVGFAVLIVVAVFGVKLPEGMRQSVKQITGVTVPDTERLQIAGAKPSDLPKTPSSFSAAKRILYEEVYADHRTILYCSCTYSKDKKVDLQSCGVTPRKNARRASRIEAEHVFPAFHFGQHRPCWREDICATRDGTKFHGRKCCEEHDPVFRAAHNDLHNLFPAVGEVNGDRSNYRWGMIAGENREYGECNIEVDSSIRRAEPPEQVMGDIARTYFYMEDTYGIRLSGQ